ncbi:MAG TPA: sigma-54 dependent transcriptional regulator [Methylomirabilota bacterium]|jgi:DNA-binding NtrC family response regulator|nr:sigma-54 dependent transcriptional regulator [Methylomirabilota bacterium]
MPDAVHVLVVDDDVEVRSLLVAVLARDRLVVKEAASGAEAMALLSREEFDVALVDIKMPDHSGLDILRWARASEIDAELIVLTGHADVETAVEAMRLGAYDFVAKPWKNAELLEIVAKAAEKKALRRENSALKEVITRRDGMPTIVGNSPEIRDVLSVIGRVAVSDSPVLIHGESGTGKELIARTIHLQSRRGPRAFVSINCGALPDTLLETELFGHKKGAFSGAIASRIGLFEAANGGTLFLDEIGEMSPAMQVRLLRTLDSGEVRRVGEERAFHVDVRVVAATSKDLHHEAGDGRFRWDLYYRVSTVVVEVPPLRRRPGDLPMLLEHFLAPFARAGKALRFSQDAIDRLVAYDWPGNIRELRNLIERLQILREGQQITAADLPPELGRAAPAPAADEPAALTSLAEMERRHVERVLAATGWNKAKAARVLEVDIKTLNKKIRDFSILRPA